MLDMWWYWRRQSAIVNVKFCVVDGTIRTSTVLQNVRKWPSLKKGEITISRIFLPLCNIVQWLTIHKFVFNYILHLRLYFTISRILKRDIYNITHCFALFYNITLLSPAMLRIHGQHGTPSRNNPPRSSTLIAPPCHTYATNIIITHFTCVVRLLSIILWVWS